MIKPLIDLSNTQAKDKNTIDKLTAKILIQLLDNKVTNGNNFKHNTQVDVVLPLLWNTIATVKTQAIAIAKDVPIIGSQLVATIEGLTINHLQLVNKNQILTSQSNLIATNLYIGSTVMPLNMLFHNITEE